MKYKQKREESISEVMIIIITILIIVKNLTMVIIVITIMIIESDYSNTSWKLKGGNLPWSTKEIAEKFFIFFSF